jgi:phosphoacetylglucosamine mutase
MAGRVGIVAKYPTLVDELKKYPPPEGVKLKYGTAGFREKAAILDSTFFRMGMLGILRSRQLEKTIGLMVTASHNAAPDNGIKMVDPDGGMLDASWEVHAYNLANATAEEVPGVLDAVIEAEGISLEKFGSIFVGKDTRDSSEKLSALARDGALLLAGNVLDFGLQTTPQLHHIVRMFNFQKSDWASEEGYYAMLAEAYEMVLAGADPNKAGRGRLVVDGAHGVGALKMPVMAEKLTAFLDIEVRNAVGAGELNHLCGAEHVQKGRVPPAGVAAGADNDVRLCSLDGDSDRIVYHFFDGAADGEWKLMDGDKIAALIASFLKENLATLGLDKEFKMAAVQTAYANGNSGGYIQGLGVEVPLAKTGVKFVHHKALEYDIGLYFEANGHGTVVFKDHVVEKLKELYNSTKDEKEETPAKLAAQRLYFSTQLINQAVGDAISDALIVEAILTIKGWGLAEWAATYDDLPSRQTKLAVEDRAFVKVNDNETQVLEPKELQDEISRLAAAVENGRAFVRPSGTENVVRVYAEAKTAELADKLALDVCQATHRLAKGLGEVPTSFLS